MTSCPSIGVLLVGLNGAIGSTVVCGAEVAKRDQNLALGLYTETPLFTGLKLPSLCQLRFGGWDHQPGSPADYCHKYGVIPEGLLRRLVTDSRKVEAQQGFCSDLDHPSVRPAKGRGFRDPLEAIDKIREDIRVFKRANDSDITTVVYLASAHKDSRVGADAGSLNDLIDQIHRSGSATPPGLVYCIAAIKEDCNFVDFTPSPTLDCRVLFDEFRTRGKLLAGRDGSTGQTLLKSLLAEMFSARNLRVRGWFSSNFLGNSDGKVLSDPEYVQTKMHDKTFGLPEILGYRELDHTVSIDYHPIRGDNKEAFDVVDFEGFLGLPMAMSVNWRGRDSILAAPIVIDLVRILTFAESKGERGTPPYLGVFFKNPFGAPRGLGFSGHLRQLSKQVEEWKLGRGLKWMSNI